LFKRFAIISAVALMLLFIYETAVLATINAGLEWQYQDDNLSAAALRMNCYLSERWTARGIYQWEDKDLSAGLTYRQSKGWRVGSYVGVGFRDLLNKTAPEYDFAEKMELITGVEINLGKERGGASLILEGRAVGSAIVNDSDCEALDPIISVALNFRIPGGQGRTRVKVPDSISESDFDLLVRLVAAEAGGEPYEGQVAVAAVVLNRMRSYQFPDSVRGVIYQKNQFSSVPKLPYIQPSESCRKAAVEAINGVDPSKGALYFYNPETSSKEGIRFFNSANLRVTARIGNHVFLTE
jgi:N-acetylmuramoyl-L-alanine amidase